MLGSLRDTRIARKISLRKLAGEMGVHSTHLSRAEKFQIIPSVVFVMRWAGALGIDFAGLYRDALDSREGDGGNG